MTKRRKNRKPTVMVDNPHLQGRRHHPEPDLGEDQTGCRALTRVRRFPFVIVNET